MKKITFKKQALILTLVAALGVAVYLNYYFSDHPLMADRDAASGGNLGEAVFVDDSGGNAEKNDASALATGTKVSYFDQARKNREKARDEAVDLVKDIAADLPSDSDAAKKVLEQTTALAQAVERESSIESLIRAKGFDDCVVYIADKKCSVVVKADNLTQAQTLQISEIVAAQSDVVAQNMNIMAVNS